MNKFWPLLIYFGYINATLLTHTRTRPILKTTHIQPLSIITQQSLFNLIGKTKATSEDLSRFSF